MSANIRAVLMPLAIILGIFLPELHSLSVLLPYLIGTMMFLTFISEVPPQRHGFTFRISVRALLSGLFLIGILALLSYFLHLPKEFLLAGILICLCPPANAAPAMAKILGGNPVLMLKIFIVGHLIACFSIPLLFGFVSHSGSLETFRDMAFAIFNKMQSIVTIPLALALGIRSFYPEIADKLVRFQKWTVCIWSFAVFVIISNAGYQVRGMQNLDLHIFVGMAILSLVLCVLLFILGYYTEKNGHPFEASQSMGQKNTVLIILLAQTFAKDLPLVVLGPIWYVIWQNLVLSYMAAKAKK